MTGVGRGMWTRALPLQRQSNFAPKRRGYPLLFPLMLKENEPERVRSIRIACWKMSIR